MSNFILFPPQLLPYKKKTRKWRKTILDWADSKTFFNYSPVRNSVIHKKINYDLLDGKLHMDDMGLIVNPDNTKAGYIPDKILHYPIINSKLYVLRGEESKRVFDFKVIVTNPNSISEIEKNKKELLLQNLQLLILNSSQSEEEFNLELDKLNDYYTYEWQDFREIRANALLNHYIKEYNMPLMFNEGFMDAMAVAEEIYQCDIRGGEPVIEKVNPLKIRVFKSGYSNKIEDADMIIMEDYWSPGKIVDTYYDVLTPKDRKYIEEVALSENSDTDSMDNIDDRAGYVNVEAGNQITSEEGFFWDPLGKLDGVTSSLLPYDLAGNIRVLRVYWKSRRKIKKVKSYDPYTGEEIFDFYTEDYIIDEDRGEEEEIFYVNEAWEGTKIGKDIYVNMRPRVIQYNRISNPSRCHFGIIGSIYNLNENRPFSLVDMMKPYSYLYDIIHDRLNKLMANNLGKIIRLDIAKVPKGWSIDKWMYYLKVNHIAVEDSFKEGTVGAATGKLAAALNNASNGSIDAELGNSIQLSINMLEFIKMEMSEVAGISKLREGQISNRETVGGVERATLLSSHITEWLFLRHDDVKKRALECFLETAKIALKGRNKKFSYILSDLSQTIIDVDGDEFAESDYGLVVDNSNGTLELNNKMDMLALAALLNQAVDFSTIMKLYSSGSIAEKLRMVEANEKKLKEMQQQQLLQLQEMQNQQILAQMQLQQAELELKENANIRDNETKVLIANIQAASNDDGIEDSEYSLEAKDKLMESMRQFDERLKLDKERLAFDKDKAKTDAELKRKQINKKSNISSK